MKLSKFNMTSMLLTLFEGLFGLMLLINPKSFTTVILKFFGILFLVIGVIYLVGYLKDRMSYNTVTPIAMTVLLILGAVLTFGTNFIFGIVSFVAIIYGAVMIVYGIFKAQYYFQCKKSNAKISVMALASAIVSVILGIIVIFNPFGTQMAILRAVGITLIVEAIVDIIDMIVSL